MGQGDPGGKHQGGVRAAGATRRRAAQPVSRQALSCPPSFVGVGDGTPRQPDADRRPAMFARDDRCLPSPPRLDRAIRQAPTGPSDCPVKFGQAGQAGSDNNRVSAIEKRSQRHDRQERRCSIGRRYGLADNPILRQSQMNWPVTERVPA
jgi:hypothetical protein